MRIVIDTNIFISGIFFGGEPRKILNLIEEKTITPCFTVETFTELERVLTHNKFIKQRDLLSFSIYDFLNEIKSFSLLFPSPSNLPLVIKEDKADNHFLFCALSSKAVYIISGDNHLLKLKKFQKISIITPKQFLAKLKTKN